MPSLPESTRHWLHVSVAGRIRRAIRRPRGSEEARCQSVHLQIWFWTTVTCVMGVVLSLADRGPSRFALMWLAFALPIGAATWIVARWPRLRGTVSVTVYALVLGFSVFVLFGGSGLDSAMAYPGLLAVLTGASVGEAPRRALWMGFLCLVILLAHPLVSEDPTQAWAFNDTAAVVAAVVGLLFCGYLSSLLWRLTLGELKGRNQENAELTEGLIRASEELEARVATRTDELTARSHELRARTAQLRHSLEEQERLKRELIEQAVRDELTGLHNRRYFLKQLDELAEEAGTFTLLLIDVDHFKSINDDFGHPTGDHTLVQVTQELAAGVRTDDTVARIGGEEFAVLLPRTPQRQGELLAEELRERVAALSWAPPLSARNITISVGVAGVARGDYVVPSKLLSRADRALYRAKMAGRNRVVVDLTHELNTGRWTGR